MNHSYFTNHPLPARPEDLPTFEDSHELDRRNARGQKPALPPAPAGGTVGLDFNEDWTAQPYADAPRPDNDIRIHGGRIRSQQNRYVDPNTSNRRFDGYGSSLHDRKGRNNAGYQKHVPHRPPWNGGGSRYYDAPSTDMTHQPSTYDHPRDANRYRPNYPSGSRDYYGSSVWAFYNSLSLFS